MSLRAVVRRTLVVVCGVAAVGTAFSGAASGDAPETGAGTPGASIVVRPSDDLVDGQTVGVSGEGFCCGRIVVTQCFRQDGMLFCGVPLATGTTRDGPIGEEGHFGPFAVTVTEALTAFDPVSGSQIAHTCTDDCFLRAVRQQSPFRVAEHHISFASSVAGDVRPGKGCGDRNHAHQRRAECKAKARQVS